MAYSINTGDKGGVAIVADIKIPITNVVKNGDVNVGETLLTYGTCRE